MSQRGSFTTEFIYCPKCFAVIWEAFCARWERKRFEPTQLLDSDGVHYPIIAGKIGDGDTGSENVFMRALIVELQDSRKLCCKVWVVVLGESQEPEAMLIGETEDWPGPYANDSEKADG